MKNKEIIEDALHIIENELTECSCTQHNFMYKCKHTVRRLKNLLNEGLFEDVEEFEVRLCETKGKV